MDNGIPSGDRGIQPGAGQQDLSRSTSLPKKTGSFSTKDVVKHPGKTYIPDQHSSESDNKAICEWNISIAENEQIFFTAAASLEEQTGKTGAEAKTALAKQLTEISSSASSIMSDYNKRVVALGDNGELSPSTVRQLQQKISLNLRVCVEELSELRGQAASTSQKAAKLSVPKLVKDTQTAIGRFNSHLASLKGALDAASTKISPELAVAKIDSELRALQERLPQLSKAKQLDDFSTQARLQIGRARDYASKPEAVQKSWSSAKKSQAETQKAVLNKTYEDVWNLRKNKFNALDLSTTKKKVKLNSSEISTIKQALQAHLTNAIMALKDFTTWQPSPTPQPSPRVEHNSPATKSASASVATNDQKQPIAPPKPPVAPLPPHFVNTSRQLISPATRVLMEAVETSTSPADQADQMKTLQNHLLTKYEEKYRHIEPLLTYATQKNRLMRGTETEFLASMQHALKGLKDYKQALSADPFDDKALAALKAADAGLAKLDDMKDKVPPQLVHLLTEALPVNPQPEDHLVNLMNRQLLQGDDLFMGAPRDAARYQVMTDYLENALTKGRDAAAPHLKQMLDKTFESSDSVATLLEKSRSPEEANALIPLYTGWSANGAAVLKEVDQLAQQTAKDLPGNKVLEGVKAYKDLTQSLQKQNMDEAAETASAQNQQLREVLQQHISDMTHQRLNNRKWLQKQFSHSKVCEEVAKELNTQLGGLAAIAIEPGKKLSEAKPAVILNFSSSLEKNSVEKTREEFAKGINQNTPALQELKQKLTAEEHAKLFQFEGSHCRWTPHPPKMLRAQVARFGRDFHLSQQAIQLAASKKPELQRYADARAAVVKIAAQDSWNIPPVRGLSRLRSSTKRATQELQALESRMKTIAELPLREIQTTVANEKDRVVAMLKDRVISSEQATAALKPLFALLQAANSMNKNAAYQLKPNTSMAPPATYTIPLEKLHKALNFHFLHRMFGTKKWKALEHAKALVAISQHCKHTPMQALNMVSGYRSDPTVKGDPYHKDLEKALKAYGDHLNTQIVPSGRLVEVD